ncbi:MAG: DUF1501 domain-containing protein [bacterium]
MQDYHSFSRRDFMKFVLGSSVLGSVGSLGMMNTASAIATPSFSDYKALVCVFLKGGNDSFNMLIPNHNDALSGYDNYASIRGNLAVNRTALDLPNLDSSSLGSGNLNPYYDTGSLDSAYTKGLFDLSDKGIDLGVNGVMPELAQLIQTNKASIIGNIGTLVKPVSRDEILADSADLPVFLFAHNHQQRILQTGQAHTLGDIGWAGQIADQWSGINGGSSFGLNISYSGNDRMLVGHQTSPLILSAGNPPRFAEMISGGNHADNDRVALFKALLGQSSASPSGNVNFDASNTVIATDPFQQAHSAMLNKSYDTFDQLYQVWHNNNLNYQRTGSYGESLFSKPTMDHLGFSNDIGGSLIAQLNAVAKMIHLSASGAFSTPFNRQIFLVSLGGFDTHSAQLSKHPLLLRELSLGLWKFQQAMEELGHANQVTTFTMSDFGRTMKNNGDGTDHAWGAHHIVMGGDGTNAAGNIQGGQMLGTLPDISLGGNEDHGSKGRIIPAIGQDQLNASLCRWFGMDEGSLATIFPNLANFGANNTNAYLDSLFAS